MLNDFQHLAFYSFNLWYFSMRLTSALPSVMAVAGMGLSNKPHWSQTPNGDLTVNGACNCISGITERFMRVRTMAGIHMSK